MPILRHFDTITFSQSCSYSNILCPRHCNWLQWSFLFSKTLYYTMVLTISQMFWVTQWSNLLPRHCELHNGLTYFRDIVFCVMVSGIIPSHHQYHFLWYQKPVTIYRFQNKKYEISKGQTNPSSTKAELSLHSSKFSSETFIIKSSWSWPSMDCFRTT